MVLSHKIMLIGCALLSTNNFAMLSLTKATALKRIPLRYCTDSVQKEVKKQKRKNIKIIPTEDISTLKNFNSGDQKQINSTNVNNCCLATATNALVKVIKDKSVTLRNIPITKTTKYLSSYATNNKQKFINTSCLNKISLYTNIAVSGSFLSQAIAHLDPVLLVTLIPQVTALATLCPTDMHDIIKKIESYSRQINNEEINAILKIIRNKKADISCSSIRDEIMSLQQSDSESKNFFKTQYKQRIESYNQLQNDLTIAEKLLIKNFQPFLSSITLNQNNIDSIISVVKNYQYKHMANTFINAILGSCVIYPFSCLYCQSLMVSPGLIAALINWYVSYQSERVVEKTGLVELLEAHKKHYYTKNPNPIIEISSE